MDQSVEQTIRLHLGVKGVNPERNASGELPLLHPITELRVANCTVCGDPLETMDENKNCLRCGSRSRTRSLAPIISNVVSLLLPSNVQQGLPLLAFATTSVEQKLLTPFFPTRESVSLYGTYSTDHKTGVDVRDLSRYDDGSFAGVFSILLFDYFAEHEQALREIYRVLAPGGILFTHLASYRLL